MEKISVAKLQTSIIKLERQVTDLKDRLAIQIEKTIQSKKSLEYYKNNIQKMIEEAVNKAVAEVRKEYEQIIKDKEEDI